MSLHSENLSMELLRDIFRTHPMWNYNFYLIIESNDNLEPIGIGFKEIKIYNNTNNEFVNIEKDEISNTALQIICENGMTHDGSTHKFMEDINNNVEIKYNILLMEIEKSQGDFKERIENGRKTVTSVKQALMMKNANSLSLETNGFDAMSNEIFIKKFKFMIDDIKVIEMPEEIAREKAKVAVSKLF